MHFDASCLVMPLSTIGKEALCFWVVRPSVRFPSVRRQSVRMSVFHQARAAIIVRLSGRCLSGPSVRPSVRPSVVRPSGRPLSVSPAVVS